MARIEWAMLCEMAFMDSHDRLCVVGITTQLTVPRLPIALNRLMMVARLTDVRQIEEIAVGAAVVSPSGAWRPPSDDEDRGIEMAREFVLVTLKDLVLAEEGIYSFRLKLSDQPPVSIDVPVMTARPTSQLDVH